MTDAIEDRTSKIENPCSPLLEVRGVTKRFPGVRALHNVSLSVGRGEVLALIGENGAGKSTLMKILAGVQPPDEGEMLIDGRAVRFKGVEDALSAGVSLIHQELNLADNLDIGANVFLGREARRMGVIDKSRIAREAQRYMDMVGLDESPRRLVNTLSIGRQQLVEIAKALSTDARVLIMDEPTSSLSLHETEALFRVVKDLRRRGVSVVYISHRLGEVRELADRVLVLRDGQNAGEIADRSQIDHERMVRMMVGRDVSQYYHRQAHAPGGTVLKVTALRTPAHPRHALTFGVRAGEVVGMAGLVGAGRSELLTTLFGVTPAVGGTIEVDGKAVSLRSPREAIAAGVALVPEDRKQEGLVLGMPVRANLSLPSLRRDGRAGFVNRVAEAAISAKMIPAMRIKTPSDRQVVQYLSGGNQQKVVLGKWLALEPRLMLLDEPTRGIDVGAKEEIYKLMHELAGRGVAILFVSSEMEEVLSLSDRVLVMHEGRLTGELRREQLSEEAVMRLATGAEPLAA